MTCIQGMTSKGAGGGGARGDRLGPTARARLLHLATRPSIQDANSCMIRKMCSCSASNGRRCLKCLLL